MPPINQDDAMDKMQALRKVPLFASLSDDKLEMIAALTAKKNYTKENVIFFEEDEGDSFFIINEGHVKVAKFSDEGKEFILSMLGPGDFFGDMSLLDSEPRSATVIALENTQVTIIRRSDFHAALREYPSIAIELLSEISKRLREANRKIGNLALLDVYGRLARTLIDFARSEGMTRNDGRISFKRPTHQAIANMIGTSRETVTRTLGDLHRRGYLELSGKEIILNDNFEEDIEEFTTS